VGFLDSFLGGFGGGGGGYSDFGGFGNNSPITFRDTLPGGQPAASVPTTSGSDWWQIGGMVLGTAGRLYLQNRAQRQAASAARRASVQFGTAPAQQTLRGGAVYGGRRRLRF